jgi:N-methylhydantoinase A
MLVVGIDVGGTFTDLVLFDSTSGRVAVTKTSSTANQADGVLDAMRRLEVTTSQLDRVVHGTTVATNAIVQRRGVKVALVTTRGFRDVLEVGQTRRRVPDTMFQPTFRRPEPLVSRPLRLEVTERTRHTGAVIAPVDDGELGRLAEDLHEAGVEAVAVCFLHAYMNEANERHTRDVLARRLPGVFITHSAEVIPEHREFERFSTTVINAYVSPVLGRYLTRLAERLNTEGFGGPLYTMSSSGGAMTVEQASRLGVKTILSGPVGGVQATVFVGETAGLRHVISYDMGGTSTDVALIHDLTPALSSENIVESPVRPQVDINSVGAGGGGVHGSMQRGRDRRALGRFQDRPHYDRGGREPTVTDANLILGRLGPTICWPDWSRPTRLGRTGARAPQRPDGRPLAHHLADGIVRLACGDGHGDARSLDPTRARSSRFHLVAFGGAGPARHQPGRRAPGSRASSCRPHRATSRRSACSRLTCGTTS